MISKKLGEIDNIKSIEGDIYYGKKENCCRKLEDEQDSQ